MHVAIGVDQSPLEVQTEVEVPFIANPSLHVYVTLSPTTYVSR